MLEFRITNLEGAVGEIRGAVKSIDASLQTLARLELHHAETRDGLGRAFTAINDHEIRMRAVEAEMPMAKLVRNWVIGGVIGVVVLVGVAVVGLVLSK